MLVGRGLRSTDRNQFEATARDAQRRLPHDLNTGTNQSAMVKHRSEVLVCLCVCMPANCYATVKTNFS